MHIKMELDGVPYEKIMLKHLRFPCQENSTYGLNGIERDTIATPACSGCKKYESVLLNVASLQDYLKGYSSYCNRCETDSLEARLFFPITRDGVLHYQIACTHCTVSTMQQLHIDRTTETYLELGRHIQKGLTYSRLKAGLERRFYASSRLRTLIHFLGSDVKTTSAFLAQWMTNSLDYFGHEQGLREYARGGYILPPIFPR